MSNHFNRLTSKVSAFNRNKRSLYDKFSNPPIYFVKRRWTDAIFSMSQWWWGFQTGEQYSNRGRTNTVNALNNRHESLDLKQRLISAALEWALLTILAICLSNLSLPPIITPRGINKNNHGLRVSANPVLTATGLVNGRWRFSTPYRIDTLNRSPKNVTGEYVGDPCSCAKFGAHPPLGGFWANWWNITYFYICPFLELTYRSDASTHLRAWWIKRRGLAQGCAFWVSLTLLSIQG